MSKEQKIAFQQTLSKATGVELLDAGTEKVREVNWHLVSLCLFAAFVFGIVLMAIESHL